VQSVLLLLVCGFGNATHAQIRSDSGKAIDIFQVDESPVLDGILMTTHGHLQPLLKICMK